MDPANVAVFGLAFAGHGAFENSSSHGDSLSTAFHDELHELFQRRSVLHGAALILKNIKESHGTLNDGSHGFKPCFLAQRFLNGLQETSKNASKKTHGT
jgi:hypothetical protein